MTSDVRFGLHTGPFPIDGTDPQTFLQQFDAMLTAVEGRFDSAWFDDHLEPWAEFVPGDTANLECLSTVAWSAARHPGLQVGSLVLCQAFRPPGLVARMAATLQWLTGGRFVLGMGAGWLEREYRAFGYDFPPAPVRIAQLAEAVQAVRAAWAGTSFQGVHYRIDGAAAVPLPSPPPVMVGGSGERLTMRVVAQHADWCNFRSTPESYAHKLDVLRRHCDEVGRDYDDIVKTYNAEVVAVAPTEAAARALAEGSAFSDDYPTVGTPEQVADHLRPLVDLGVRHLILRFVDFPSTAGAELFAAEVIPLLRG